MRLCRDLLKLLPQTMQFRPQLRAYIALATQSTDRFVFGKLGMADLRLQIMCERLHIRQCPFGLFPRRCLRRQRSLSPLQSTARRRDHTRCATVRRRLVTLVPSQNGYRNITVLDEAATMRTATKPIPTTEPVKRAMRRFRSFRLWPMSLALVTLPLTQ